VCFGRSAEGESPCVYPLRPIKVVSVRWIGGVVLLIVAWFARTVQVIPLPEKGLLVVRVSLNRLDRKPRYLSLLLLIAVKD
jgi:hypothetical protein